MRQLHPLAFHEQFTASGIYIYEQNGLSAGITEAWTVHQLPDKSHLIRVDRDARPTALGTSVLLEALRDEVGHILRFDLHLYNPNGQSVKQAKASYTIFDDHIQIGRQINDQPRLEEETEIPANTVINPPMYIFTGSAVRQIITLGGSQIPIFLPNITEPDNNQVLSGIIEKRSALLVGAETITHSGEPIPVNRYQFIGGNDNEQSVLWLDETGLLIAYEYQSWRITLKNLARSKNLTA
jgi:hypothetical protein